MTNVLEALIGAILEGDVSRVEKLLDEHRGACVAGETTFDRYEPGIVHHIYCGDSALHVAAAAHRVDVVDMLLAAGANTGAASNRRRSQPIHYAADGHPESPSWNPGSQVATVRLLVRSGAGINVQDNNGATPLHRAVRTRCAAAVSCLLGLGGDPAIRNKSGSTPFHLAVQNTGRGGSGTEAAREAQAEIIHAFLDRGVSSALKDGTGRTVLECARSESVRQFFVQGGSRTS